MIVDTPLTLLSTSGAQSYSASLTSTLDWRAREGTSFTLANMVRGLRPSQSPFRITAFPTT